MCQFEFKPNFNSESLDNFDTFTEMSRISDIACDTAKDVLTFVPKMAIFISGQGLSQNVDLFYFLSQFYYLEFQIACWLFCAINRPLSIFLAFWLLYFGSFDQNQFKSDFYVKKVLKIAKIVIFGTHSLEKVAFLRSLWKQI